MPTRSHLAAVLCIGAAVAACKQPAPKCNVAHGAFWAQYKLVEGDGDCAMLPGEQLDVQSYYEPRSASDKRPDYNKAALAIAPSSTTLPLLDADGIAQEDIPHAFGHFASAEPDAQGVCAVEMVSAVELRKPFVPAEPIDMCTTAPEQPEIDVRYEFSNVRVYYTAAAIGTQFSADLTYTNAGCVAKYKVVAVTPMVPCGLPIDAGAPEEEEPSEEPQDAAASEDVMDDQDAGCPPPDEPEPEPGPMMPDDSLCVNAGINPDFQVECDPQALMCVIAGRAPSLP